MIVTRKSLSRRTVLRGIGAAIALPFLDAMVPAFAAASRSAVAGIRRFGAMYIGNGINQPVWKQPSDGSLKLNQILSSLVSVQERLVVVTGLDNKAGLASDGGQHPRAQSAWLTGCRARRTDGTDMHLGVSMDQILAQEFSKETQLGSIELIMEPTDLAGNCGFGYSCAYTNTLAWRTPTTPLPAESNPRNLFERLFGASESTDPEVRRHELRLEASMLDDVKEQLQGIRRELGPNDRRRLDEFLDALRDVERRIQMAEEQSTADVPILNKPAGIPSDFDEHARLLLDLQLLAFQADLTRVFTFVLARETSVRGYPEIGVPDSHHPLSHHQNNAEKLARLAKLNALHVKQLGYFVNRLQSTSEGDGSMLDKTMMLIGSGLGDGNVHTPTNVPIALVAGRDFGMKGNRTIHCPEGTPLSNLQLTMLEKLGLPMEKFGDSNGELRLIHDV